MIRLFVHRIPSAALLVTFAVLTLSVAASAAASTIRCKPTDVESESTTLIGASGSISFAAMAEFQVPLILLEIVSVITSCPASTSGANTL